MKEKNYDITKNLAGDCLQYKWIKKQKSNLKRLLRPCAFCFYYSCEKCTIDKEICNNDGSGGLIGNILSKYGNVFLKDIDPEEYNLIRDILQEMKENGYISKELRLVIKEHRRV